MSIISLKRLIKSEATGDFIFIFCSFGCLADAFFSSMPCGLFYLMTWGGGTVAIYLDMYHLLYLNILIFFQEFFAIQTGR